PQFSLNLPKGTKEQFEQRVAAIPEDKRIWWRAYKVEEGETLSSIAKKLHVSPVTLREANRLDNESALEEFENLPLDSGKASPHLCGGRKPERVRQVSFQRAEESRES